MAGRQGRLTLNTPLATAALGRAAEAGARAGAEHLLTVSRRQVPIEEGTLKQSGKVSSDGNGVAAVSYDTPYAVRQHEDLTYRHDPGRKAKYLEDPMNGSTAAIARVIAQNAAREIS